MTEILDKAKQWLTSTFDAETQKEINELITNDSNDLTDRFYKDMEFGTGGMRGVMGAGTNTVMSTVSAESALGCELENTPTCKDKYDYKTNGKDWP